MAYGKLASVYDSMMSDVPYETWVDYVLKIWKMLGATPSTVLDMACGTGSASVLLAKKGFNVTGMDLSPEMLKIAREKNNKINFIQADMRDFSLNKKFDAVVCLYDSLNYLLRESEIQDAFRNVQKHLNRTGVFVFDVNTIHKIIDIWDTDTSCFDIDGAHICWKNVLDKETNTTSILLDVFAKNGNGYERFNETHRERGYPLDFLQECLKKAGFAVKGVWGAASTFSPSFEPPNPKTQRAYFAAVKK